MTSIRCLGGCRRARDAPGLGDIRGFLFPNADSPPNACATRRFRWWTSGCSVCPLTSTFARISLVPNPVTLFSRDLLFLPATGRCRIDRRTPISVRWNAFRGQGLGGLAYWLVGGWSSARLLSSARCSTSDLMVISGGAGGAKPLVRQIHGVIDWAGPLPCGNVRAVCGCLPCWALWRPNPASSIGEAWPRCRRSAG